MIRIDGYEIDASLSEDHSFESEVSSYPIERGSDIVDNIRPLPISVTIEGLVTDTPIGPIASRRGDVDERGQLINLPSNDAYAFLLEIRSRREPVEIETSLKVFKDMALTSLSVPRDSRTGHALRFRATFVQVLLVTNERTTVRVAIPRAASKKNKGFKAALKVKDTETKASVSRVLAATPPSSKTESNRVLLKSGGADLHGLR